MSDPLISHSLISYEKPLSAVSAQNCRTVSDIDMISRRFSQSGEDVNIMAELMANSVLSEEPTEPLKVDTHSGNSFSRASKFSDGISLIEAFKALKSPVKDTSTHRIKAFTPKKWQIWYWNRNTDKHLRQWEDYLQMKTGFSNRIEFWSSYNEVNGYEFGLLSRHFDYCVFKEGIVPMWEDSANRLGGRWILEFPRKRDWRHISHLDEMWLKVLLSITGLNEGLEAYIDDICGAVLMIRYDVNKIAVWTDNCNNTLVNLKIGELLKTSTGFSGKMYYQSHESNVKKIVVKPEHRIGLKPRAKRERY